MKKYLLLPVGVVWLLAALSQSLLAADRELVFLSDQLRARTARLIWETQGYFSDAANFARLDQYGRAMHDSAEALAKSAGADIVEHARIDKDLATLAHYRVAFSKELDLLQLQLQGVWKDAYKGSFAEEDLALVRARLGAIEQFVAATNRQLHPTLPDLGVAPAVYSDPIVMSHVCPNPVPPILVVPPTWWWSGGSGDGSVAPPPAPPGDGGASPPGGGGGGSASPPGGRFPAVPPGRLPPGVEGLRPTIPGIPGVRLPGGGIRLPPIGGVGGGGAGVGIGGGVGGGIGGGIGGGPGGIRGIGDISGALSGAGVGGAGGRGGAAASAIGGLGSAISPETRGRLMGGLFGSSPSGSGSGTGGSRGTFSDALSPGIRAGILRNAIGGSSSTGIGTGAGSGAATGSARGTGVPGASGISGAGSVRIPGIR